MRNSKRDCQRAARLPDQNPRWCHSHITKRETCIQGGFEILVVFEVELPQPEPMGRTLLRLRSPRDAARVRGGVFMSHRSRPIQRCTAGRSWTCQLPIPVGCRQRHAPTPPIRSKGYRNASSFHVKHRASPSPGRHQRPYTGNLKSPMNSRDGMNCRVRACALN